MVGEIFRFLLDFSILGGLLDLPVLCGGGGGGDEAFDDDEEEEEEGDEDDEEEEEDLDEDEDDELEEPIESEPEELAESDDELEDGDVEGALRFLLNMAEVATALAASVSDSEEEDEAMCSLADTVFANKS